MVNLDEIKLFILDMDGTIYLGQELIEGTDDFINYLDKIGKNYVFLTNNSSKNALDYQQKLHNLGIDTTVDNVVTSGQVTAHYVEQKYGSEDINLYILGTESLKEEFKKIGFNIIENKNKRIDCLVLGFDTTLTYQKLWDAHDLIRKGCDYVATNPDLVCPLEKKKTMP